MLLSDYLKTRSQHISVNRPEISGLTENNQSAPSQKPPVNENGQTFAEALREKLDKSGGIEFSNHAIRRLDSRSIDIEENGKLERLNKGVELAAEKGSNEALVLVDTTAFIVNIRNNKVITTMEKDDLIGNVFTNIDSTVII